MHLRRLVCMVHVMACIGETTSVHFNECTLYQLANTCVELHSANEFVYGRAFKRALSRYSGFLCRFFAVKNGAEETRGRGAGQRVAGIGRTFFKFGVRNRSTSKYQSMQSLSCSKLGIGN